MILESIHKDIDKYLQENRSSLWHYGSPNPCRVGSHPIWSEHLLHCLVDVGRRCLASTRMTAKRLVVHPLSVEALHRPNLSKPIENRSRQRSVLLTDSTADGPGGVRPGEVMTSNLL